ncbi:MAG TPA: RHS repeat-associated core domain-containing protein [Burkholderiales bacterium]|nr:RHS repeat-associated core domain-containing protein [Burkholderiales bacterium]
MLSAQTAAGHSHGKGQPKAYGVDKAPGNAYAYGLSRGSGESFAYSLDNADNLTRIAGPDGAQTAAYNNLNQLTSFAGRVHRHDANGNLIDDGARTYQWDAENRLVAIGYQAQPSKSTTMRYDGLSRRTAIVEADGAAPTETRYLWCGQAICQSRSATDAVAKRYYPAGEVLATTGKKLYYGVDHLGSVRDALDAATGGDVASFDYAPYGNPTRSSGVVATDVRYAGMFYHQGSGLYLTHYRAYDPRTGRWLSRDPIGGEGGLNLYAYVGGNPLSYTDPTGESPVLLLKELLKELKEAITKDAQKSLKPEHRKNEEKPKKDNKSEAGSDSSNLICREQE